VRDRQAF